MVKKADLRSGTIKMHVARHITMLGSLPPIKGISKYTLSLCEQLLKTYEIDFISFKSIYPKFLYPGNPIDKNASKPELQGLVIEEKLSWYNPLGWISAGFRIKKGLLHAQWWSYVLAPIYYVVLSIAKIRGVKILLTVHNVLPHEINFVSKILNRIVLTCAHKIIVHTEDNKRSFIRLFGKFFSPEDIYVVPHGLMIHPPVMSMDRSAIRRDLRLADGENVGLIFGNIRDYKGLDIALEAAGRLKREGFPIKLIVAGKVWGNWEKYEEIIQRNNLSDHLILDLQYISDDLINRYFTASDIVLLTYRGFESQSGVGSVALGYDVPMLVSSTGGLADYVGHDPNAIVEPDAENIALSIRKICGDASIREGILSAMECARKKLDWVTIAQQTVQIYEKALLKE